MRKNLLLGLLFAATAIPSVAPSIAAVTNADQTELVEFYNKTLDHYFVTIDPLEISNLDTGFFIGWARTGYRFPVVKYSVNVPNTSPVCRFYGRPEVGIDSHFYSSKADECEQVKVKFPQQWQFEAAEVFRAFAVNPNTGQCPTDTSPVYRLWNQRPDVNHRYTDQQSVYDAMIAKGYKAEGDGSPLQPVAFCQPTGLSVVPPPPAGSPSCTLSGNTGTPAVGSTLNLTATCTGNPQAYTWTGCTSTSSTCQVTRTTTGIAKYIVTATNAQGPGAPQDLTVTWGASGPVPICLIGTSNFTPTVGNTITLSANCNTTPTRFDWLQCSTTVLGICNFIPACSNTAATCRVTSSQTGEAYYAVAGANANGTGQKHSATVDWKASGGGGNPVIAPVCDLIASNNQPLVGDSIILGASCSNDPTGYSWTGVSCSQAQCSTSSQVTGAKTYAVTGSNSAGSSTASTQVVWGGTSIPQTPSCTLTPSSTAPSVGQTITIAASCTNSPSTYAWTGCTGSSANCSDTATATGPKNYVLTATNGAGAGTASVVVTWKGAPTAAPVCTVVSSAPTAYVGQAVTLTATCSNSPLFYAWTNCSSTSATCNAAASAPGLQTYSIQSSNSIGASVPVSASVTWQQSSGGGDFCGSYPNVKRVTKAWNDIVPILTHKNGGFAADGVFVVEFTVPSGAGNFGTAGYTQIAEFPVGPTTRQMSLSKSACDFRPSDRTGANGPYAYSNGNTASIQWNIGAQPAALVAGETYFFNFRNWSIDLDRISCESTSFCNAIIQMNFPSN